MRSVMADGYLPPFQFDRLRWHLPVDSVENLPRGKMVQANDAVFVVEKAGSFFVFGHGKWNEFKFQWANPADADNWGIVYEF